MTLSIVIPVYNAKDYFEQTLASVLATTKSEFELIILDDFSEPEVRDYLRSLESPNIPIRKIFNAKHQWTNYNWNLGAILAEGDYIAILNSDILLSDGWDLKLIKGLESATITCPYTLKQNEEKTYLQDLHPLVRGIDPKMINGAAFMFKAKDKEKLFPIPPRLKHWCGDNWLADIANQLQGVQFIKGVTIKHFISQSAKTIPAQEYKNRILMDLEAYEQMSDRNMTPIKDTI